MIKKTLFCISSRMKGYPVFGEHLMTQAPGILRIWYKTPIIKCSRWSGYFYNINSPVISYLPVQIFCKYLAFWKHHFWEELIIRSRSSYSIYRRIRVSLSFFRISGRNSGNPEKHEILKKTHWKQPPKQACDICICLFIGDIFRNYGQILASLPQPNNLENNVQKPKNHPFFSGKPEMLVKAMRSNLSCCAFNLLLSLIKNECCWISIHLACVLLEKNDCFIQ